MPAGDEEAMAAKVKKVLDDKALRQSMSKAGREETERWSWEAATSVLRNVQYQKVRVRGSYLYLCRLSLIAFAVKLIGSPPCRKLCVPLILDQAKH